MSRMKTNNPPDVERLFDEVQKDSEDEKLPGQKNHEPLVKIQIVQVPWGPNDPRFIEAFERATGGPQTILHDIVGRRRR